MEDRTRYGGLGLYELASVGISVLDLFDEGILIVDRNRRIVFYNEKMARLDGLTREEVVGKNLFEVFPFFVPEGSTVERVLRTGRPVLDQVQTYMNYKGQRVTTLNSTIPILVGGEPVAAFEVARDIVRLRELAEKVVDLQQELIQRNPARQVARRVGAARYRFEDIICVSPRLQACLGLARKAASTSSTVLIWGETGTGKELFAQSIHNASARRNMPFIAQNCAALPDTLLDSILFGTVYGAFTGAVDRPGLFEQANRGTLLLDEINAMSWELQAKLLRVLQDGQVRRVGGTRDMPVDVRIIATANLNPLEAVRQGKFRDDLFYRVSVVSLELPPLRERREEIPVLVAHFLDRYGQEFGKKVAGFSEEAMEFLRAYDWPGNVRELEHVVESLLIVAEDGQRIGPEQIPAHIRQAVRSPTALVAAAGEAPGGLRAERVAESLSAIMHEVERRVIAGVLERTGGNISQAARLLGVKRQALQYRIKKLCLSRQEFA